MVWSLERTVKVVKGPCSYWRGSYNLITPRSLPTHITKPWLLAHLDQSLVVLRISLLQCISK